MKIINKKGFTLIELLAVIVVLAVVMLIAVTAVVPMMERARKQAFITEAIEIAEAAEDYYAYKSMTSSISEYNGVSCVNVSDLMGQYIEEKGKSNYEGVVWFTKGKIKHIYLNNDKNNLDKAYHIWEIAGDLANKDISVVVDEDALSDQVVTFCGPNAYGSDSKVMYDTWWN